MTQIMNKKQLRKAFNNMLRNHPDDETFIVDNETSDYIHIDVSLDL